MPTSEKQIEGRLSLLYAISLFGQSADIGRLQQLFQAAINQSENEWQEWLRDILASDLVNQLDQELIISDNGMVVLSFFQDRIPADTMERLNAITAQANALSQYEWQTWYDAKHHMLNLMQLKDHQRIIGIQLYLTPEEYLEFDDLRFSPDERFREALKQLIQKEKET